jgi:protein subunit release factor B
VAKQAQYLKQKLKLQQHEDEEDEEEQQEQEPASGDKLWGANKRAYYQNEDVEVSWQARGCPGRTTGGGGGGCRQKDRSGISVAQWLRNPLE